MICKGILNELKNDNTVKWDETLESVVTSGLKAKFEQNPELAQFLIAKWAEGGNLLG